MPELRRQRLRASPFTPAAASVAEQQRAFRNGRSGALIVPAENRNGLPETPGYVYRGRRYPWAEAVLAAAEAIHGAPVPTSLDTVAHRGIRVVNFPLRATRSVPQRGSGTCHYCSPSRRPPRN